MKHKMPELQSRIRFRIRFGNTKLRNYNAKCDADSASVTPRYTDATAKINFQMNTESEPDDELIWDRKTPYEISCRWSNDIQKRGE
jgi:hypothetical protein